MGNTILATALPSISNDLAGARNYTDAVTAYLLPKALATPVGGRLVDANPPVRVVFLGCLLFLIGTIGSSQASSMNGLVAWRVLSGLGGGALVASIYALLDLLVPPRRQGAVQATVATTLGLGAALAPVIGGVVTQHLGWRWCFYLNIPPLVFCLAYLLRLPHLPARGRASLDVPGIVALSLMACPLLLALSWGGSDLPWTSSPILSLLGLTALGFWLFHRVERRREHPLFHPELLRDPTIGWAFLAAFALGGGYLSSLLYLPLYLQVVKGFSPVQAGLSLLPFVIGSITGALLSSRQVTRVGRYRGLAVFGTGAAALNFALLYALLEGPAWIAPLLGLQFTLAICFGLVTDLFSMAVQNVTPAHRQGMLSSSLEFVRQLGSALGIAAVGSLLLVQLDRKLPAQISQVLEPLGMNVTVTQFEDADEVRQIARETSARLQATARRCRSGDPDALKELAANPALTPELRAEFQARSQTPDLLSPRLESELQALAQETNRRLQHTLGQACTDAEQQVLALCGILCLVACLAAARMPDNLLRDDLLEE